MQRKLERAIRKQKKRVLVAEATGDKEKLLTDQIKLQRYRQEYSRFSKAAGLRTEEERLFVSGFGRKQAAKSGNISSNSGKSIANSNGIDTMGLYRETANTGAFSVLPERMSKKHIRHVAKDFGVDLEGLTLHIDANEDLLRIPLTGRADPERIGGITFFPNAFISREELLRTLFHERVHVEQFRKHGADFVQRNRAHFEALAYEAENEFISALKEKGALK